MGAQFVRCFRGNNSAETNAIRKRKVGRNETAHGTAQRSHSVAGTLSEKGAATARMANCTDFARFGADTAPFDEPRSVERIGRMHCHTDTV